MGLEPEKAVDDVRARLLEHAGPDDVRLLVEARLELDDRGDLLAALGGAHERLDDGRVAAGAVERLLDRQDIGVVRRSRDELEDAVEGLVRVLQQHRPVRAGRAKMSSTSRSGGTGCGMNGSSRSPRPSSSRDCARWPSRSADVQHPAGGVDVAVGLEACRAFTSLASDPGGGSPATSRRGRRCPRSRRRSSWAIGLEQILGLLLVDLDVEVPRDAKDVEAFDPHRPGRSSCVSRDQVLEQDERAARRAAALGVRMPATVKQAWERRGHLHDPEPRPRACPSPSEHDPEVQALVLGPWGEGVARIDRDRRQDREHLAVKARVEVGPAPPPRARSGLTKTTPGFGEPSAGAPRG